MAKKPHGLWKRASNGWWYTSRTVERDGKKQVEQVKLSRSKGTAAKKLAGMLQEEPDAPSDDSPIGEVLAAYLTHVQASGKVQRFKDLKIAYHDFAKHFGEVRVKNLRPAHMVEWAELHKAPGKGKARPWSPSTVRFKVDAIRTAINWGIGREEIRKNPLGKYHGPANERRDHLVTPAEYKSLLAHAKEPGWLHDLLTIQGHTGCRPSEFCRATAADYSEANRSITLKDHKTRKKKGGQRVVWLTDDANKVVNKLVAKYPDGPILRKTNGSPVSKYDVVKWFRTLKERCRKAGKPVSPAVGSYSLRHMWITNALANGLDVSVVATLAGNTVPVLMRHYSHLLSRPDAMRAAAEKAKPR